MIAKSMFSIRAYQNNTNQVSSLEAALFSFKLIERLASFDNIFSELHYYHSEKREVFSVKEGELERLAELMLAKEWYEITKFEQINKPTIEYKRKLGGFSSWFEIKLESQKAFELVIGYGYKTNGINIHHFNREVKFNYLWYEKLFKVILESENWLFAEISVSHNTVFEIYKKYDLKYPLGWLTYFSNELNIKIPELPNVRGEQYQNGRILKTDDIDFLKDKESFETYKTRLNGFLEKIKEANTSTE